MNNFYDLRKICLMISVCFCSAAYCQKSITFKVEELSPPQLRLAVSGYDSLWDYMWSFEYKDQGYNKSEIPLLNKVAQSAAPDTLVAFYLKGRYHPFFYGMYQAYADHRPFVLSPDMIWLLICQGFAHHVNADSEKMRPYFVQHLGKLSLVVRNDNIMLDDPNSAWEKVFPEFTKQIAEYVGNDLANLMVADFSTTTPASKLASEATLMYAMKNYFEFIVMMVSCGIPEITLEGTPEDWQKVLEKTRRLAKYDLKWWTKELEPLLAEFVKASKGKVNKKFWQEMFKCHSQKKYAADNIVDGWIVKFFPYDKKGKRNNLKELEGCDNLPDEIVKVDLKHIEANPDGTTTETPLELWAGFIGCEQNEKNMALKPIIGWMIRKKDISNDAFMQKLKVNAADDSSWGGINIRVKEIPEEILALSNIKKLTVNFTGKIIIPERLAQINIKRLELFGEIDDAEIQRIKNMFHDNILMINRKSYGDIDGTFKFIFVGDSIKQ
ncbi:MAG: DUF4419 domain-containing protein [Dysgonamonadaceae bacterium]|jgi:hypothetical protein|nr:DUF4419 domain-containing protein [Dysgonamonadaceae bacterium]